MKSPRAIIKRAMTKLPKDDQRVEYAPTKGTPTSHCGKTTEWPAGYCRYFDKPSECWRVSGKIVPKGKCKLYERATAG